MEYSDLGFPCFSLHSILLAICFIATCNCDCGHSTLMKIFPGNDLAGKLATRVFSLRFFFFLQEFAVRSKDEAAK